MDRRTFTTTSSAAAGCHSHRGDRLRAHAQPPGSIGHDNRRFEAVVRFRKAIVSLKREITGDLASGTEKPRGRTIAAC
jgi:hypothetical protein